MYLGFFRENTLKKNDGVREQAYFQLLLGIAR